MSWIRGRWTVVSLLLATPVTLLMLTICAVAQVVTTTVTDTIYRANGTPAGGTVIVSWPAFSTAAGQAVAAGSTSATIGSNGLLAMQLTPNAGAMPMGTYYTAVYHLDDGSVNREYWVVPVSTSSVHISAIRSTVLPTSVAMQTVSKSYVDTAIAAAIAGNPLESSNPYVLKAGDTMTGPLALSGDPTASTQAATKSYVDTNIAAVASGIAQKVSILPSTTQTVAQPAGTQLEVNRENGVEYASQYQTQRGGNGIANAVASSDCASGCEIKAEQNYNSTERYVPSTWNSQTHLEDKRGGGRRDIYVDPESVQAPGYEAGQVISVTSTRGGAAIHQLTGTQTPLSAGLSINHEALTGGSNQYIQGLNVPYFKTQYSALMVNGTYNTQGQHVLAPQQINCFGVGDCLIGSQFIYSSGGMRDNADEGAHPFDLQIREDGHVFTGSCSAGCTTGSTSVTIASTSAAGTQGDGRYLINTTPSKVITAGSLVGPGPAGPNASASFSGTSFPVSTFFQVAGAIPSQADSTAPGTVTVAIVTTGLPSGFSSNTAAAPANSGIACLADPLAQVNGIENFETANYTVVDGTHLQLTLNKAHYASATVAIGGLCGYGIEQKVDTASGIRQVFPVVGSFSSTGLYYASGSTYIVGIMTKTSGYANISQAITSVVRNNNVVTLTTAGNMQYDLNGLAVTVAGIADSSYNGTFTATSTGPNTLTYVQTGANSSSTGGTLAVLTGSYALYPMAEVLSVFNPATKQIDGQMTLAPNTVAWAANDTVEQPHYHQQKIGPDVEFIGQTMPRPNTAQLAGIQYEGNNGPGLKGWVISNAAAPSSYFGNGGTHFVPDAAYVAQGLWKHTMEVEAGDQSVFTVHCNSHGCGRWNSAYNLFELDTNVGTDTISFSEGSSVLGINLRGGHYYFSPGAFGADTINAGVVNATTLNGAVTASQLPVFRASGTSHAQGAVPDPGATAGTSRFLREDGTWATPTGGGTTGSSAGAGIPSGALADYDFMQGSGSVLTDKSGSNNSATLGSGAVAPSWTSQGLFLPAGTNVSLPATLNSGQTFVFAVYLNPITTSLPPNCCASLMTSSLGNAGLNLSMFYVEADGSAMTNVYAPSIWHGGPVTGAKARVSGFHVFAYVLGRGANSTVDHLYIDGVEAGTYSVQGVSGDYQSAGNLFLGQSGAQWNGGIDQTFYRARIYPTALAASDIAAISAAFRSEVAARGVAVSPVQVPLGAPKLHAIGDSITVGVGSTPWSSLLNLTTPQSYQVTNWGISDFAVAEALSSEPNRAATQCQTSTGMPSLAVVFMGTNDFHKHASPSATDIFGDLSGEIQLLKKAGCTVFVGTMLPRTGTDSGGTAQDTDKNNYDALILREAKHVGADAIIDFAADPRLGADGANTNTTYFLSDQTHPTQQGQQLLAQIASNTINYYFGYSLANPNVVTSPTYTLASEDGAVTAAPTANAAWTMPDCTGPSGMTYTISNTQSAYSLTIVGQANQPINGLTTPVTVPANSTVTLRDVANPKSVSGCHWVM